MQPDLILAAAAVSGWGSIQTVLLGVLSVITAITVALVGIQIGTVRTLRESNKDLRDRVADLEKERLEDRAENVELSSENQLLKAMVTGKVEWVAVTDQLEDHHREAIGHWTATERQLGQILTAIKATP